ncbi:MAG TPA: hypothetical protein VMT16_15125, partial [Thermoanaerobaculia bacterium]|nr:hypothetical protein [Thermoanaerobaculia bacterium]
MMRGLLAVTARELGAWRGALWLALAAAALVLAAPWLPGLERHPPGDARVAAALALGGLLVALLALFVGSGVIGRDLAEGRLAFFYALPLRAGTLAAGKLLAGAIVLYGAAALVLAPAAATGAVGVGLFVPGSGTSRDPLGSLQAVALLLAPLALLLLAHTYGVALRARTAWLALDLLALPLAGWWVLRGAGALAGMLALDLLATGLLTVFLLMLAALIAGVVAQLARGRVLPAAAHRWLSATAWAGVLVVALGFFGWSRWVLAAGPQQLRAVALAESAPAGPWLAVSGPLAHRPGYRPWLLVDPESGGWLRLGPAGEGWYGPEVAFTAAGDRAVWVRRQGGPWSPGEVVALDLTAAPPRRTPLPLALPPGEATLALDAAGERLATIAAGTLAVHQLPAGRTVAAARLDDAQGVAWRLLWPAADGTWRAAWVGYSSGGNGAHLHLAHLDPASRRLTAARRPLGTDAAWPLLAPGGDRLVLLRGFAGRDGVSLVDTASGNRVASLAAPERTALRAARFLADGRLLLAESRRGRVA